MSPVRLFWRLSLAAVFLVVSATARLQAGDGRPAAVQVTIDWFKLTDVEESTEKAYSDVFGAANISGFLNSAIQVNGRPASGWFGTVKFFTLAARPPEVKSCIDHALAAANLMETPATVREFLEGATRSSR